MAKLRFNDAVWSATDECKKGGNVEKAKVYAMLAIAIAINEHDLTEIGAELKRGFVSIEKI
jgi:hypothetical protein